MKRDRDRIGGNGTARGEPSLKIERVAASHDIFVDRIREPQIGYDPGIAQTDEIKGNVGGLRRFGKVRSRGRHAVREQNDGGERATLIGLDDGFDTVAEARSISFRLQSEHRLANRGCVLLFGRAGHEPRLGIHGINVNLHPLLAKQFIEPVRALAREEQLGELQAVGLRQVHGGGELLGLRANDRIAKVVHGGHARGGVEQDDDLGPALALEGELPLRKKYEQGEQEGAAAECGGEQDATEASGCGAFAPVRSESNRGAAECDASGEEPVGLQIAGERGRSFEHEAVVLAGRSRGKPDGPSDAVLRRVPPLHWKEAEDVARAVRPDRDADDRNDGGQNRECSQVPEDSQKRMAFDRAHGSTRSARWPEPPGENHFPHHDAQRDQHGPAGQCGPVWAGSADPVDPTIGGRTSLTDLGDDLDRADGFEVGRFGAAKVEFAAPGSRNLGRIRGKGAIAGLADA